MSSHALKKQVWVVYYSLYGHVRTMAEEVAKGVKQSGCDVKIYQVPETLPKEIIDLMKGVPQSNFFDKHPLIPFDDFPKPDGFLFGMPTRFGMMPAQWKALWDRTGQFWAKGSLVGKPAGLFFSTGSLGGGQETTALTAVTQLTHHGMLFVPLGYTSPIVSDNTVLHGGSPYGAGTFADKGQRQPSDLEKELAFTQGKSFGNLLNRFK